MKRLGQLWPVAAAAVAILAAAAPARAQKALVVVRHAEKVDESDDPLLSGDNLRGSPGSTQFEFEVSRDYPLVTLVTMVAPSPDWFVGVSALSLRERRQGP